MAQSLKIIIISFLVSLNVCIWKEILGDVFDKAIFAVLSITLVPLLYDLLYDKKKR